MASVPKRCIQMLREIIDRIERERNIDRESLALVLEIKDQEAVSYLYERAHKSGVKYIAEPGGSIRDDHVIATCNKYGMVMSFTGIRLFHH